MQFKLLGVLLCVIQSLQLQAQLNSKVVEDLSFKSEIMCKEMQYSIYLPADYYHSQRSYPVLFLLHGFGGNHVAWIQQGNMQFTTDVLIASGRATPMIIVMPHASDSWYINSAQRDGDYEDFFIKEFVPYIEATYRCRGGGRNRAIAGLSMGGYGALLYALKYPGHFSSCCPLSAAVFTDEEVVTMSTQAESRYHFIRNVFESDTSRDIQRYWDHNSTLQLIKKMPEEQKHKVQFYIDCGDDDHLYVGNAALHVALRDARVPHQFRVRDGGHTWNYWRTSLPEVLEFVSAGFVGN